MSLSRLLEFIRGEVFLWSVDSEVSVFRSGWGAPILHLIIVMRQKMCSFISLVAFSQVLIFFWFTNTFIVIRPFQSA